MNIIDVMIERWRDPVKEDERQELYRLFKRDLKFNRTEANELFNLVSKYNLMFSLSVDNLSINIVEDFNSKVMSGLLKDERVRPIWALVSYDYIKMWGNAKSYRYLIDQIVERAGKQCEGEGREISGGLFTYKGVR